MAEITRNFDTFRTRGSQLVRQKRETTLMRRWYLCQWTGDGRSEQTAFRPALVAELSRKEIGAGHQIDLRLDHQKPDGWCLMAMELRGPPHNRARKRDDVIYLFSDDQPGDVIEDWPMQLRTRVANALGFAGIETPWAGDPRQCIEDIRMECTKKRKEYGTLRGASFADRLRIVEKARRKAPGAGRNGFLFA